ncbi:MAG: hypothetical protein IRY99_24315, partial [Isosphaeraceae bacterium]|nr:hypothetical protein [Isosphaeraceae bacterium]
AEDDAGVFYRDAEEFQALMSAIGRRKREALRLFEPLPAQDAFFRSRAAERLLRGGNRGGKTLPAAVEAARALTGQDPYDKYPKENGRFIAVGKDLTHCGKVMYRKLFRPGAFKIIRDPESNEWRSFRPLDPWDQEHEHRAREAPPLIPKRYVKEIAWENKKDDIPKTIKFHNGWELSFFSSAGAPPQGWDVDVCWFDEEIEHILWYSEMAARLLDRNGRFYWSATPQVGSQHLFDLHTRAMEQEGTVVVTVEEFYLNLLDNPHISQEAKDQFISTLSEDDIRIRVYGDFALTGTKVYPDFLPRGVHGWRDADDKLASFPIPDDWTRFLAIDPGVQVCAVLFVAIPPPHVERDRVYIYDELYIKRCNAAIFADRLKKKIGGQEFQQFFFDQRAGRIPEIGSGKTVEEQYSTALKAAGVKCVKTGHRFTWSTASGGDDVKAGIEAIRDGLNVRADGTARWVVFVDKCPQFIWEAERYSYKKLPSGIVTDEPIKSNDHLMDCWRYLAAGNLRYIKPKKPKQKLGYTHEAIRQKQLRARAQGRHDGRIHLG